MLGERPKRKIKKSFTPIKKTRKDLTKEFQYELFKSTLRFRTPSIGIVPDKEGQHLMPEETKRLDTKLENQFGKLGTGEGAGTWFRSTSEDDE